MNEKLIKKIKLLRQISPDPDYSRRSLLAITGAGTENRAESPYALHLPLLMRLGSVLALSVLLVFIAAKNDVPLKIAGLDPQGLLAEAEELDQQLRVAEISLHPAKSIETALKEAAQNGPDHLNALVLKKEAAGLTPETYGNPQIDEALRALAE